ncbi:MAG: glutamyl-tRNA amidotransferase [Oscillospiraceae bacterium]|nr:glutamyl-tRNA amidotransferase [Oscillospiraceae bacterium]
MILVDIYAASVDKNYDFDLDETVEVGVIIDEIVEMIGQNEKTTISGNVQSLALCDIERRTMLPKNASLAQCGVKNGMSLLLV